MTISTLNSVLLAKAPSGVKLHSLTKVDTLSTDQRMPLSFSDHFTEQALDSKQLIKQIKTDKFPIVPTHDKPLTEADTQPNITLADVTAMLPSLPRLETPLGTTPRQAPTLSDEVQHATALLVGQQLSESTHTPRTAASNPKASTNSQQPPILGDKSLLDDRSRELSAITPPTQTAMITAAATPTTPIALKNTPSAEGSSITPPTLATPVAQSMFTMEKIATIEIRAPLGSAQWLQDLSQHIIIQKPGQQTVHLKLHPEELGDVKISLTLHKDQAELMMVSAHGQVRAALEAAIPHLRQALAENGIQLGQSHVGQDMPASQQESQSYPQQSGQPAQETLVSDNRAEVSSPSQSSAQLVTLPSSGIDLIA